MVGRILKTDAANVGAVLIPKAGLKHVKHNLQDQRERIQVGFLK